MKTYDPKTPEDVQEIIKSAFGPIFEAILKGELENHLGYSSNDKSEKDTKNRRNGSNPKTLKTSLGKVPINAPRDRDGTFKPEIVPKRTTDVSSIEGKVLSMYAKGMSQRDISDIIFDEIKTRGVEDVLFISMDGLKGLEEGAKAIFPDAVVQRCIVHLVRNSIKYVPSKDPKTCIFGH